MPPAHRLRPRSRRASDSSDHLGDPTPARTATPAMHCPRPPPSMITRGYDAILTGAPRHVQTPGTFSNPTAASPPTTFTSRLQRNSPNHHSACALFDSGNATPAVALPASSSVAISSESSASTSAPTMPAAIVISGEPMWKTALLPLRPSEQQGSVSHQQFTSPTKPKDHLAPKANLTRFVEREIIDSVMGHSSNPGLSPTPSAVVLSLFQQCLAVPAHQNTKDLRLRHRNLCQLQLGSDSQSRDQVEESFKRRRTNPWGVQRLPCYEDEVCFAD